MSPVIVGSIIVAGGGLFTALLTAWIGRRRPSDHSADDRSGTVTAPKEKEADEE
jgi:hypothetical protein